MLVETYIEVLLADEVLADHVWEVWNAGLISDEVAAVAWEHVVTAGGSNSNDHIWEMFGKIKNGLVKID